MRPGELTASISAARTLRARFDEMVQSGHLRRWSAVQHCIENPYQPNLVWWPVHFGHQMQLDLREAVSQQIFIFGAYEEDLAEYLCRTLRSGDTVLDVGAHIGYFSLLAGHLVGPAGHVYAFEPVAATRHHLATNVGISGLGHVSVEPAAVWSSAGEIALNDFGSDWSAFNSVRGIRLPAERDVAPVATITVPCIDLDTFCAGRGIAPDLVKIDVESAELEVLRGMARILTVDRPIVTIEVGDFEHLIASGAPSSRAVLEEIASYGYDLFDLAPGEITAHELKDGEPYAYANVICVPAGR